MCGHGVGNIDEGAENDTGEDLYVLDVPRPLPIEPLMYLSGNSIDIIIKQSVGESKHAEISNRKYISRFSRTTV